MKRETEQDEVLVRYLLGQMDEEEQQRIEEHYIGDHEFFEHLLVVEDELIDRYVRGQLSSQQRESFETHFLRTPKRLKRLEFAQTWNYYTSAHEKNTRTLPFIPPVASRPAFISSRRASWLAAAAALIVLVGGSWLLLDRARLKSELERVDAQREEVEKERRRLQEQIAEQNARASQPVRPPDDQTNPDKPLTPDQGPGQRAPYGIVALVLTPGHLRGSGETDRLVIHPDTRSVNLKLRFVGEDYDSYRIVISSVEGREVYNRPARKDRADRAGKTVSLTVPSRLFDEQDYTLKLSGISPPAPPEYIAEYFFRVLRK